MAIGPDPKKSDGKGGVGTVACGEQFVTVAQGSGVEFDALVGGREWVNILRWNRDVVEEGRARLLLVAVVVASGYPPLVTPPHVNAAPVDLVASRVRGDGREHLNTDASSREDNVRVGLIV